MCSTRDRIAALLWAEESVSISQSNPFRYASGDLRPLFVDCQRAIANPGAADSIVASLTNAISHHAVSIDTVVAVNTPSLPLATLLADKLLLPLATVRDAPKNHGKSGWIAGDIQAGARALIVADVISTETSVPTAIDVLRSVRARPVLCAAVYSNQIGYIEPILARQEVPLVLLTDLDAVLAHGVTSNSLSPSQADAIRQVRFPAPAHSTWHVSQRHRAKIAALLLDSDVVQWRPNDPITLSSGLRSPVYIDARILLSSPRARSAVIEALVDIVGAELADQHVEAFAGTAMAGVPYATLLAHELGLPWTYVTAQSERHGMMSRIRGSVERGATVVIVEDLVTTGGSLMGTVSSLRDAGARVTSCLSILTYGLSEAKQGLERAAVDLHSLTDIQTLLSLAVSRNHIASRDEKQVRAWLSSPSTWAPQARPYFRLRRLFHRLPARIRAA